VCWGCDLDSKVKIAARTLYHLVCAIPVVVRDRNEIYPNEIPVSGFPDWPLTTTPGPRGF
jgi:hypothetical protein